MALLASNVTAKWGPQRFQARTPLVEKEIEAGTPTTDSLYSIEFHSLIISVFCIHAANFCFQTFNH